MSEERRGPRRIGPDRRKILKLHVPERRSGIERRKIVDRRVPGQVLVVESERVFCDLVCGVIEEAGHDVRRAVTRTDLLAAFLEDDIEVAVLVVPPVETLELIREGHPDTEIVALVIDPDEASASLGTSVALLEPFTEEKVRAAIRIALRRARAPAAGDSSA